jgi:putative ABC transport system permease protein
MPAPRLANALLARVIAADDFEGISGDLEEIYSTDVVPRAGVRAAQIWYWSQVLSVIGARVFRARDRSPAVPRRIAMAAIRQDLAYAVRALRQQPGFTATAVFTLALGIGANVAIFALVNAIVLKPLPFADPDRLMMVHMLAPDREAPGTYRTMVWSYPKYTVLRDHQTVFESTAIVADDTWNITGSNLPERVWGELVEASYFQTLGTTLQLGRSFTAEETRAPGSAPIVMLGHSFWQRRFAGDVNVLGRSLGLNGTPHTIVGVLPRGFRGLSGQADIWVPVMTLPADNLAEAWNHSYWLVARRKADVSADQAIAAVKVLGDQVNAQYAPGGWRKDAEQHAPPWGATAVALNDERIDPMIRRSVLIMLAAVGAVLLIVCVNLANLMLVRALGRQREVGIRLALGASRLRIVRQLMTESLLLSVSGALAGLAVAYGVVTAGAALLPDLRMVLPRQMGSQSAGLTRVGLGTFGLDSTTLLFTFLVAAAAAVLFGLGPAWRASRRDLTSTIRAGSSGSVSQGTSRWSVRNFLIVGEVALSLVLLSAAGLMLKSVFQLQSTELGFQPQSLLTFRLSMPSPQYDPPRATQLFVQLVDRLHGQPGIDAVAYNNCAPLSGGCNGTTATFPDRPKTPVGSGPAVGVYWASPTYFDTLGIRVIRGRVFDDHDRVGQPKVVVINETAARAFWGNTDAVGKRIGVGQGGFSDGAEVVGVVADVRYGAVETSVKPDVYLPLLQSARSSGLIFVRSHVPPDRLIPSLRQQVRDLDADLPLVDIKTMDDRFGDATWRTRMSAWLLGVYAALALVLAAVGIYGVLSQGVEQRAREIGVRMAVGASRADIFRLILGRALIFAAAGVALGIALALPAMRLLTALLYQVRPGDPIVLATLAAVLLVVALVASYLPARRATRVDPMTALRAE